MRKLVKIKKNQKTILNERRGLLINFIEANNMYIMNCFFNKKPRKLSQRCSTHRIEKEIKFIISSQHIQDVYVI